ncbi:hypothetical protein [Pandoraea cepalis]|nr:hypothetical protein [Pandoraea cepalis]
MFAPGSGEFEAQLRIVLRRGQSLPRSSTRSRVPGLGKLRGWPETRGYYVFCIEVDMLARILAVFLVVGSLLSLAGCNTVDGVGQDISGAARTVKRAL